MSRQIRLLADQGIPLEKNRLPSAISLTRYDSAGGIPKTVDQYDALFVRTVSPVDKTTIPAHPVHLRFIGSATAGVDHVDREWLDENGIGFSYAPGCNGRAVGEYAGTAAVIWSLLTDNILSGLTAGIVGAGSTGTAVAKQFARLGISCKMHDPPREEREAGFKSVPVDDILECDLLSFHTPLIKNGARPTYHWLNGQKLDNRRFRLII
ncbi:MAG: NAD(P)-dependent oxidoreductase, partial [Balneolaceae bacterium]